MQIKRNEGKNLKRVGFRAKDSRQCMHITLQVVLSQSQAKKLHKS